MTPTQLDHLNRIKTHLETLLANAEKRTPGRWLAASESVWAKDEEDERVCDQCGGWDPDFIASCAGNAEAGWRSTLATIAVLIDCNPTGRTESSSSQLLNSILAAWPLESLKL